MNSATITYWSPDLDIKGNKKSMNEWMICEASFVTRCSRPKKFPKDGCIPSGIAKKDKAHFFVNTLWWNMSTTAFIDRTSHITPVHATVPLNNNIATFFEINVATHHKTTWWIRIDNQVPTNYCGSWRVQVLWKRNGNGWRTRAHFVSSEFSIKKNK